MTTSNVKLLPLPEDYDQNPAGNAEIQDYARANVEHHTAAKDAEIEALRAERDEARRAYFDAVNRLAPKADQAERLAEALRNLLTVGDKFTGDQDEDAATWCDVTDAARAALHPAATIKGEDT